MILEGAILGTITMAGFVFTYKKLPDKVKQFVVRHPILTEVVMVVSFYEIMGMTVIAHVAVAVMSLEGIALMHIARNPQDFQFLFDAMDNAKSKLNGALGKLRELNQKHIEGNKLSLTE